MSILSRGAALTRRTDSGFRGGIAASMSSALLLVFIGVAAEPSPETTRCLILTGLGGVPEYEENFEKWADSTEILCREGIGARTLRLDGRELQRTEILRAFQEGNADRSTSVWVFLIGHGNHDGRQFKFNIKGPDLTGQDLLAVVEQLPEESVYLVVATSCSGGLAEELKGPQRVILTATRGEREMYPPLFMSFFLEAASSAEADTNKDRRISIAEAFSFVDARVRSWYQEEGRIQTEHPTLTDAEGGAPRAPLTYLSSPPEQSYRSLEARQLSPQRIRLEREVEALKLRKTEMSSQEYYAELERLLVELARLNQRIRTLEEGP